MTDSTSFAFGTEYVSDFLVAEWFQGWRITLVELEPKEAKGFNKDGTPGRRLAQALKQLAEWNQWIQDHRTYFADRLAPNAEELMEYLVSRRSRSAIFAEHLRHMDFYPYRNVVILGRRGDDFAKEQDRRAMLTGFTRNNVEIISYDALLDLVEGPRHEYG